MSTLALSLTLAAALLHALWNAMMKASGDRGLVLASISAAHVAVGVVLIVFVAPPARESWDNIFASTLIHYAYYVFLFTAYRLGDLSQVYPISRGVAPMLVALGAVVFADEMLLPQGWAAVTLVSLGIAALAFGRLGRAAPGAVAAALATGTMIAAYSVVDGVGARQSDSPLGYAGWLFVMEFPVVLFIVLRRQGIPLRNQMRTLLFGFLGGLCATAAYGLVIYAKTLAPLAAVSAVRESSVIVAALIGVWLFGERPWALRLVCALIVAAGVTLLAMSPAPHSEMAR